VFLEKALKISCRNGDDERDESNHSENGLYEMRVLPPGAKLSPTFTGIF
jgi:hypothetical protein